MATMRSSGTGLAKVEGSARAILTAERVALNFVGTSQRHRHRDKRAG